RDVHPADRQDAGAAEGGCADHAAGSYALGQATVQAPGVLARLGWQRVGAGQVRRQVRLDRAGADTGSAAAVRDAEGLVQVEMGDVRAPLAGLRQAEHGVEVGAVGVHLPAVLVDDLADLHHVFLEHAVGGGVGHHDRRQAVGILAGPGADVLDVDVAVRVALGHHHLHAAQLGRGRVGAVGGLGDQADVALPFAPGL